MCFHGNDFPRMAFLKNAFQEMQEMHDWEKASKYRLLILSVGVLLQGRNYLISQWTS